MRNKPQSPQTIRLLGGLLIFIGALLAGGMGALMLWIRSIIANPASTVRFNESAPESDLIFPVLSAVAAFGVAAMAAGVWQVATGTRNKTLIWIMLGIWVVMMIGATAITAVF